MNPFAKLSARQWQALVYLVTFERWGVPFTPMASRRDGWPESMRVASIRAYASLVRRGLVTREVGTGRPRFRLAVSPRAVLNAAVDGDVESIDVEDLRRRVCLAEREATRRETRRENERVAGLARRQFAMIQRYGPAAFSRDDFPRG